MRNLFLFILLFTAITHNAQDGFNRQYYLNHSSSSSCTDAFEAPNGNIILTGTIADTLGGVAVNKLCIVVADANGNFLWRKDYGRNTFQYLNNGFISRSVITDASYFYLYTAVTDSNNKYFSALIKFNYNGDTLWQKKYYDPTDYLYVQGVTKSIDNGFLMTGFFEGIPRTTLLIKTDAFGNELWRKKIQKGAGLNTQVGHKIIQDSATGKIVIVGHQYESDGTEPGNFSGYANIIVTNSLGTVVAKTFFQGGGCGSGFKDLIQTQDKKCVAVGYMGQCNSSGSNPRRNKGFVVKFDLNNLNNVIWQKQFDTLSTTNLLVAITEKNNGDLILGGNLDTLNNYNIYDKPMVRIIKLDGNGNLKWKKYLERDNIYENTKFVVSANNTSDGGLLLANQLSFLFPDIKPYSVIKVNSNGCDSLAAHCATLNLVGVKEIKSEDLQVKIYPNPVKEFLNIEIQKNGDTENIEITIVNVQGQEVKKLNINHNEKIDLSDLKKGIYLIVLKQKGGAITTVKIIKE